MVPSVVCRPSASSKDFSETTGPNSIEFHMQSPDNVYLPVFNITRHQRHIEATPPDNGGKKVYIFGQVT